MGKLIREVGHNLIGPSGEHVATIHRWRKLIIILDEKWIPALKLCYPEFDIRDQGPGTH